MSGSSEMCSESKVWKMWKERDDLKKIIWGVDWTGWKYDPVMGTCKLLVFINGGPASRWLSASQGGLCSTELV